MYPSLSGLGGRRGQKPTRSSTPDLLDGRGNLGILAAQSVFSPPKSLSDLLDLPAGGAAIEEGRGIYLYRGGLYKEEEEG